MHQAKNLASPITPCGVSYYNIDNVLPSRGHQPPTHLHSGSYPVYRPVGQSVVRHMMVNVSDARRELVHVRASETSTIINSKHESLPHREFIFCFCHKPSAWQYHRQGC